MYNLCVVYVKYIAQMSLNFVAVNFITVQLYIFFNAAVVISPWSPQWEEKCTYVEKINFCLKFEWNLLNPAVSFYLFGEEKTPFLSVVVLGMLLSVFLKSSLRILKTPQKNSNSTQNDRPHVEI